MWVIYIIVILVQFETMDVNPAVKRKFDDGLDITDASKVCGVSGVFI